MVFFLSCALTIGAPARKPQRDVQRIGRWLFRRTIAAMATAEESHAASHLARNLVNLRRTRGLTQDMLARDAGVPRSTIANLE